MSSIEPETKIYVVGNSFAQNKILADYIEATLEYPCTSCQDISQISKDDLKKYKCLILLDYTDHNWKSSLNEITQKIKIMGGNNECFVSLFNVNPAHAVKKEVRKLGISAIFYINNSCDILIKGIKAILKQDLWLSRKLINTIFLEHQHYENHYSYSVSPLSFREKQIIQLLSSGFTNDMIADKLCISIHTVKSHIYNIYRKISVKNRLQAVRWASNNLKGLYSGKS